MTEEQKRTIQQNKSLHLFFEQLADQLNENGLDARVVLKPSYQLWWNAEMCKEHIWKPLQQAMLQKDSTTLLTTSEVDKVFRQLQHMFGEKFGLEMQFPSYQDLINYEKDNSKSDGVL